MHDHLQRAHTYVRRITVNMLGSADSIRFSYSPWLYNVNYILFTSKVSQTPLQLKNLFRKLQYFIQWANPIPSKREGGSCLFILYRECNVNVAAILLDYTYI